MKVNINGIWYDAENTPIQIKLSESDKKNIANMDPDKFMIMTYPNSMSLSQAEKILEEKKILDACCVCNVTEPYNSDPKDKAKKLFNKYYNFVSGWTSTNRPDENQSARFEGEEMRIGRAKQCALIAIEEILQTNPTIKGTSEDLITQIIQTKAYWYCVQQALNAL